MPPARLTVRHGSIIVHVAGLDDLAGVVEALKIADATLSFSHRAAPGVKIRSMRNTLYAFRGRLSSQHRTFVEQLRTSYS